jgi:putative transposase
LRAGWIIAADHPKFWSRLQFICKWEEVQSVEFTLIDTGFQAGGPTAEWTRAVLTAYDPGRSMSIHSYSRCWIHAIWGTLNREKLLNKRAAADLSSYLGEYAEKQGVYMKINYVNADHVDALIDLPTAFSIEKLMQLLKGSSSHWINSNNVISGKFAWGRGYSAFSVSESSVNQIARYIANQEEHHRIRTFAEELKEFIDRHGLQWKDEESR